MKISTSVHFHSEKIRDCVTVKSTSIVMPMETSTGGTSSPTSPSKEGTRPILQVKPPNPFDFTKHEEWPSWIKRFDR